MTSDGQHIDLGAPPPIPAEAQAAVAELLVRGRLHRYGESGAPPGAAARLERAFARLIGVPYAVAVNSCGSAMYLALLGAGVKPGDPVLMGAFTLAPVLGAIANAGARPVAVEITADLVIDPADLEEKAAATGARHLLVSHMRGHVGDLDRLAAICDRLGISMIEDCAHTMGASWAGRPTGSFGRVGCFSFQQAKHVNAGEGGILVTRDPDIAARAILMSGSYMLYAQNGTCPPDAVMERWRDRCPNFSLRLSEIAATLALAQLDALPDRARDWNATHDALAARLGAVPGLHLPQRPPQEEYVQSSLQFRLPEFSRDRIRRFVADCRAQGLHVKWFGADRAEGYTSAPRHWGDLPGHPVAPATQAILDTLVDIRLPLGLNDNARDRIAAIVAAAVQAAPDPVST
ncbi:aminotransferase [Halovulum dunhuangense]|uniref:Aminotransferase n=1 Tax=Halovulum dunhuangense TaxID=1505036 RepID=A0A849L6P2_9RHOB|nr:DegT/DnrJ/EryC1/StrS family aminotransferase [Halovulum dunhuangense]NNU81812.1 aminotransferase [Halovulum dunhuangense]